ncbi:transcriptional regulator, BadM/Rrf2 family [Denitrovibrio acetiphilus DSM 12809]|uniref:Transcriptional regulator, BadM/Rrf2 family n=1 Tax=Denitrovibrio acetiphilus (strain DSM 12809 / NBRC 114555 / N2460) TaxID=522772 RepID=D4H3Q9_DENA2|nr:Rrf2 family transcriptional regulator [Denitrovibrio acetiphilus]ADD69161.1 transcriptional regulator, BadM/Rrf2 family [Denitrovibrio acetiphilus DSM 12809]
MKITTKSRYAIRSIFALVLMGGDTKPVALTQIAEHEDISRKYLEQIFIKLKKSGIVEGSRGAQGGYVLARNPSDIRLKEVIYAMDGPVNISDCTQEESCDNFSSCGINWLWSGLKKTVDDYLDNITIQDLKRQAFGGKDANLS